MSNVKTQSSSSSSSPSAAVDDRGDAHADLEQEHVAAAIKALVSKGTDCTRGPMGAPPAAATGAPADTGGGGGLEPAVKSGGETKGTEVSESKPSETPAEPEPSFEPDPRLETLSTLSRHMDKVPDGLKFDQLDALSKDESLPPDLREAYANLRDDPDMLKELDNLDLQDARRLQKKRNWDDENIGHGDLRMAFNDPELQAYNQKKAEAYAENYIPSDAGALDMTPRPITEADAARELYLYTDSLPNNIDRKALEQLVKGQCPGKCPPQLIAAAQYMLDNPESFEKMAPDGNVSKGELENNVAPLIQLREEELAAIDLLKQNPELFLKGEFVTRESLLALANDESAPAEVRQAAATLHESPVAFGMLDNADKGHAARGANDGKISGGDIEALKLSKTNETPPVVSASRPNESPSELDTHAANAMLDGMGDDPALKKNRDGGSRLGRILGKLSKVLDVVKGALDVVAGFLPPPANGVVAAISAGVGAVNNFGLKAGAAMLNGVPRGEAMKQAAKDFAFDAAASAASAIPAGGAAAKGAVMAAKQAAMAGAREGVEAGVREGAEIGIKQAAKEGVESRAKSAATEAAESGTTRGTSRAGRETAEEGVESGAKYSVKEGAKETVVDTVKEELTLHVQGVISEKTGIQFGESSGEGGEGGGVGRRGRRSLRSDNGPEVDRSPQPKQADKSDAKSDPKADKSDPKADKEAERARREEEAAAREQQSASGQPQAVDLTALQAMMLMAQLQQRGKGVKPEGGKPTQALPTVGD